MNRDEYLKQNWPSYPAMPDSCLAYGRLFKKEQQGTLLTWTLSRNEKLEVFQFSDKPKYSELVEVGDLVAITSSSEFTLLAPQLKELPQRKFSPNLLRDWQSFLIEIRSYFNNRGFLEVTTPLLTECPGTEPSLDVFSTELKIGSLRKKLYLPTSPEIHLKKVLALGAEKIFEISPCFRNGELTERHQPEFRMLEWYRSFDNLNSIKNDVVELIQSLSLKLNLPSPRNVQSHSVAELFKMHMGFDLRPNTSLEELRVLAREQGVDARSAETIDDYFFLLFIEKIEPQLKAEDLIFVEKYPPYQAALARLTEDGWGDRFEVYWHGLELANAFHELNDPHVQRLRSAEDLQKKIAMGKESISLDEEFFHCLEAGMPPSGGIALGVERLFMAFHGLSHLSDLRIFPYKI